MTCHLCGHDREECGCWETIDIIEVGSEEYDALLLYLEPCHKTVQ